MAIGRWRVEDFHESLWLVWQSGWGGAPDLSAWGDALGAEEAARQVDRWFPEGWSDGGNGATLAEIAAALGEEPIWSADGPALARLRGVVRQALRDGRLIAARVELPAPVAGYQEQAAADTRPAAPPARDESTWIEIVLVDDDDPPKPMPFRRYRVELPSGEVRQGMLDAHGRAMLVGIDPGTCQVTFPDIDEREWRPVGGG